MGAREEGFHPAESRPNDAAADAGCTADAVSQPDGHPGPAESNVPGDEPRRSDGSNPMGHHAAAEPDAGPDVSPATAAAAGIRLQQPTGDAAATAASTAAAEGTPKGSFAASPARVEATATSAT